MEKLINDITQYAASVSKTPEQVLRDAIGASWKQWDSWVSGKSSPTVKSADRLYAHMAQNPALKDAS
tara:strand:- start:1799 stop:1999 length:201 start_codon:yes stop_codon:yes gene_type:complete